MSTPDSLKREAPDSLMLTGFWYRALPSDQVRRSQLHKSMLLETPVVIGREKHGRDKSGRPFALRDACPHRGMPLSYGGFDGAQVECSYHGWRFDAHSGQCQLIPSLTADQNLKVDRIYAGNYACEEQDSFVWVFMPDPGAPGAGFTRRDDPGSTAPRVPTFSSKYKTAYLSADLPCNVDHGIIGLMDPAHGPFVHQAWWWRSRHSIHEKQKQFEPIPNGFRMSAHTPSSNSAPYKLLRLYADADSITLIPFGPSLLKFVFAKFVEQDRRTMERQSEGVRGNPHLMLIDDADRPAKWYFGLKDAHLEAKRTGGDMKHPMSGPVTLKWRS